MRSSQRNSQRNSQIGTVAKRGREEDLPVVAKKAKASETIGEVKPRVVSGRFYEDKLPDRLTCIHYTHNIETGETQYGASLFRQDIPNEFEVRYGSAKKLLKAELHETALGRCVKNPVRLTLKTTHRGDLRRQLRHALGRNGVNGSSQKRLNTPSVETTLQSQKGGYKSNATTPIYYGQHSH